MDKTIERALDELFVMLKAGNANQQEMRDELLKLQLKMELLDHRTDKVSDLLTLLNELIDKDI